MLETMDEVLEVEVEDLVVDRAAVLVDPVEDEVVVPDGTGNSCERLA